MLGLFGLMMVAGVGAYAFLGDEGDTTREDDTPPEPELELEPEPQAQPEAPRAADDLAIELVTDPQTGALTVTFDPTQDGSLVLVRSSTFELMGPSGYGFGESTYDGHLLWVPEGFDLDTAVAEYEALLEDPDYQGPRFAQADDAYFAQLGAIRLDHWSLGSFSETDDGTSDGTGPIFYDDSRVNLPEIAANREIAAYSAPDDSEGAARHPLENLRAVGGPEALAFWQGVVIRDPFDWIDPGEAVQPQDGDVISGTGDDEDILNVPGDLTAVTILGGAGEDTISAGLNDTIITSDDTETDVITVDIPASLAQIHAEAPILQTGPEDIVEIEPQDSLVVTYAMARGDGVTDHFYHVVHAPDGFAPPATVLAPGDAPLTLEEFYRAAGVQLMAVGHLGSVDESDPANILDTRTAPPQFEGSGLGFLVADLQGDAVGFGTVFSTLP